MIKSSIVVTLLCTSPLVADITFEEWNRQETQAFATYQTQIDKEFEEMLKRDWQEYRAMQNYTPYQRPKPKQQPKLHTTPNIKKVVKTPPKLFNPTEPPTIPHKTTPVGYRKVSFDFFSIGVEIVYDQRLNYNLTTISNSTIANYWHKCSLANYQPLIKQIEEYRENYNLNGWATYLLVQKISQQINYDPNSQNLFSWFVLLKLGIDAKVGFSSNHIALLLCSSEKLYGVKYFTLGGKHYYQFDQEEHTKLKIYRGELKDNIYAINFINQIPKLPLKIKNRNLKFIYKNREYIFNIRYNKNLVNLYKTYPQLDHNKYLQLSELSRNFINQELRPIVSSMSEIDAIDFLLRLTQNGFRYKTDNENFGKEKVLFFEETLHYAYSDCEDRAIFFATLVKQLLNVDIVFVKYPNHLATAIRLNSTVKGDKIIYQNQQYYIADPTYSNANIGQVMPQFKNAQFQITEL